MIGDTEQSQNERPANGRHHTHMNRSERKAMQERLQALRAEVEAELKTIPGVEGVGVGFKETNGRLTDEIVFRVYVREKLPTDAVPPEQRIPAEIRGIPTDVLTLSRDQPQDDTEKYRPLKGGIQIGNGSGSVGTLGCLAKRNDEEDWVVVSNHHVLMAGDKSLSDDIDAGQPDYCACCCCGCNEIGKVLNAAIGGLVDCAIASINADITKVHEIVEIGAVAGSAEAVVGDVVRKRGRTTGLTEGEVIDVNYPTTSTAGHSFTDQLRIAPAAGFERWSNSGDSGSAVVNEDNQVVGIHWGGSEGRGTVCKIANVMSAMNIYIPGTVGEGTESLATVEKNTAASRAPIANRAAWEAVADRFLYDDRPLSRLLQRHREEVWRLIQQRRAVTVVWQRRQGPAFVAAFHRTANVPAYRVPETLHGVSFGGLLLSLAAALEEHGSPALQSDLHRHALAWIQRVQDCRTAAELLERLEELEAELESEMSKVS